MIWLAVRCAVIESFRKRLQSDQSDSRTQQSWGIKLKLNIPAVPQFIARVQYISAWTQSSWSWSECNDRNHQRALKKTRLSKELIEISQKTRLSEADHVITGSHLRGHSKAWHTQRAVLLQRKAKKKSGHGCSAELAFSRKRKKMEWNGKNKKTRTR